ncbi:MAG: DUF3159 domain-containing protein [Egibacteraceae bacterium]
MAHEYRARDLLVNPIVIVDTLAPPILFVALNAWLGLRGAAVGAVSLSLLLVAARLWRRERLLYAVSGLAGALLGVAVALASGAAEAYFLPGIVTSVVMGVACIASILVKRPLIAFSGAAITRWPLDWYWQDQVRPAYSEITWAWATFYLGKAALQSLLAARGEVGWLAVTKVLTGWPSFAVLIVVTYAYINWRLARLDAPTVDEWRAGYRPLP